MQNSYLPDVHSRGKHKHYPAVIIVRLAALPSDCSIIQSRLGLGVCTLRKTAVNFGSGVFAEENFGGFGQAGVAA